MILGVGLDVVEVSRFRKSLDRQGDAFIQRIFTSDEAAYCQKMKDPVTRFAARFAVKEAVAKAFGTGIGESIGWRDIEVVRDKSGAPSARLHGSAAELMAERGVDTIWISITHTETTGAAVAILEGTKQI